LPMINVTATTTTTTESILSSSSTKSSQYICFFAGLGFDSLLLQDYQDMQEWISRRPTGKRQKWLKRICTGVSGYTLALLTRTLPKCMDRGDATTAPSPQHEVSVRVSTNAPECVSWIDPRRGDVMRPVLLDGSASRPKRSQKQTPEQQTRASAETDKTTTTSSSVLFPLFQGRAGLVAGSTVPYYGGGLRLFPFARTTSSSTSNLESPTAHCTHPSLDGHEEFGSYLSRILSRQQCQWLWLH